MSSACTTPAVKADPDYLKEACERIMKYRPPETVCGVASSIGRDGEEMKVMSLKELADYPADMFTTVFIGKSSTVKDRQMDGDSTRLSAKKRRNSMTGKHVILFAGLQRTGTG